MEELISVLGYSSGSWNARPQHAIEIQIQNVKEEDSVQD